MSAWMYVCVDVCVRGCMRVWMYVCVCGCMCVWMYVCVDVPVLALQDVVFKLCEILQ